MKSVCCFSIMLLLLGCEAKQAAPLDEAALAKAIALAPKDSRLANLYAQSCKSCHVGQVATAPLVGSRSAWDARWQKGMPSLLQSVVAGLNGMPPSGQCFACSPADYEALIRFMAGRSEE